MFVTLTAVVSLGTSDAYVPSELDLLWSHHGNKPVVVPLRTGENTHPPWAAPSYGLVS